MRYLIDLNQQLHCNYLLKMEGHLYSTKKKEVEELTRDEFINVLRTNKDEVLYWKSEDKRLIILDGVKAFPIGWAYPTMATDFSKKKYKWIFGTIDEICIIKTENGIYLPLDEEFDPSQIENKSGRYYFLKKGNFSLNFGFGGTPNCSEPISNYRFGVHGKIQLSITDPIQFIEKVFYDPPKIYSNQLKNLVKSILYDTVQDTISEIEKKMENYEELSQNLTKWKSTNQFIKALEKYKTELKMLEKFGELGLLCEITQFRMNFRNS